MVATALVWLSVTGCIGWYKRRPAGRLAAPAKRPVVFPRAVLGTGAALCLLLPLFGASVVVISLLDFVFGRYLGK